MTVSPVGFVHVGLVLKRTGDEIGGWQDTRLSGKTPTTVTPELSHFSIFAASHHEDTFQVLSD